MNLYEFIPGQRCISDAELQMGLGTVLSVELRTLTVLFLATGETRTYAKQTAPLTRVAFTPGDTITRHDGVSIKVQKTQEEDGLLFYTGIDDSGNSVVVGEGQLDNLLQLNRPSERLFNGQIDQDKWFELRYETIQHLSRIAHSDLTGLTGCRTSLIPHQLYIAHEVANRYAPRVLLADEVGLGKTIEAGMILHQQLLKEHAHRVLIVVPETLVHQWLVEMLRRFNLYFKIFDKERCDSIDETPEENSEDEPQPEIEPENPFHTEQLVLCSIEFLAANPKRYQQALSGEWDLLVVDEAHHLQWSPDKVSTEYQMIEQLAAITKGVLLLTATPEQLGKQSHFARLRLLDSDRFHDFNAFIEEEQSYEPIAQLVEDLLTNTKLSKDDRVLLQQTIAEGDNEDLYNKLAEDTSDDDEQSAIARTSLVEHLLDRHGTGRVLFRNTRASVKGFPERQVLPHALPMPEIYVEYANEAILIEAGLMQEAEDAPMHHVTANAQWLLSPELAYESFANDLHWTSFDPRIVWLDALLEDLRPEKVLIIAANVDTALDIAFHLKTQTGIHAAVFHEGLSIVERDRAAAFFADTDNGTQVLVCSEIGSEGRNFQFAHHMVLFDLPLNPDLLEQRIGRLDRIGQNETIRIHVPYLENSAQAILFRWYHEGLSAFEHTCPAGLAVFTQMKVELLKAISRPEQDIDELINNAKSLHDKLTEELHRGRDRLLEYNSCRTHVAKALQQRAQVQDAVSELYSYMENVFDCFGVDTEIHSENCFILRPTDHIIHQFPGLTEDGMTITYNRDTALSFEDATFITWEHPLVTHAVDMVLANEMGNTALTAIKYKGVTPGTVLIECLYKLEAAQIEALQTDRYLPPTVIRVVVDEHNVNHSKNLPHKIINKQCQRVDTDTAVKVVRAKLSTLKATLEKCEAIARAQAPAIIDEARKHSTETLMRETNRLKALQQVNPSVRNEEIAFFEQQLELVTEVIDSASLRLDAIRVIVAT